MSVEELEMKEKVNHNGALTLIGMLASSPTSIPATNPSNKPISPFPSFHSQPPCSSSLVVLTLKCRARDCNEERKVAMGRK